MALKNKSRGSFWSQLHFLLRLLGLTGLLATGVGLVLAHAAGLMPPPGDVTTWEAVRAYALSLYEPARDILKDALNGFPDPDRLKLVAVALVAVGTPFALLALLVEALGGLRFAAARRGAFGTNAALQVALAVALLVGVNYYAQREGNYRRFDLTTGRLFTLPDDLQKQLRELKGETTIVVYQRQKMAGFLPDKPDSYDDAAERKVTEKIEDLVEQFRALGPRFKVVVLDTRDVSFGDQLAALPEEVRGAVEKAPENSIFFAADGKVQRLAFNDFYALDKAESRKAEDGRGNLVLRYQGPEAFAAKVLNVDQKRPRVAIAVTHEALTTEGKLEPYTLAGVRKVLTERGFETRDLILRKRSLARMGPPEPGVYTPDESKYEKLADTLTVLDAQLRFFEAQLDRWKKASAADLKKQGFDEDDRKQQTEALSSFLEQGRKQRERVAGDQQRLQVESLEEQRRLTDVKAKMDRALADCDLLILPRMTLRDVTDPRFNLPNDFHRLDDAQVAAIKDFLKAGKPVVACFGSINDAPDEPAPPGSGPDGVETMLEQLGFKLSKQTVLFDSEMGALAEYQASLQGKRPPDWMSRGDENDVPPLLPGRANAARSPDENPLARSLRLTADELGKGQGLDLRIRHPRPLSFEAKGDKLMKFDPAFLMSDPRSWNEDQPFPTEKEMPNYTDAKKRGPTAVALAAEVAVPSDWYKKGEAPAEPRTARVVVIGDGGLFVGPSLSPAQEKLLLDTSNWALGRDDQLTQEGRRWEYPRVHMAPRDRALWTWGTLAGLPLLCVFFGLVVVMWRRLR
jgi:hypothetical protein